LFPAGLDVDAGQLGLSDADLVLEPDETVFVAPAWRRRDRVAVGECIAKFIETGRASHSRNAGATYSIVDDTATYGEVKERRAVRRLSIAMPFGDGSGAPAPALGRLVPGDTAGRSGGVKVWHLHIGDSFRDVPRSHLNTAESRRSFTGRPLRLHATDYLPRPEPVPRGCGDRPSRGR
jgi:hypothetical protein